VRAQETHQGLDLGQFRHASSVTRRPC
jgi:hypothetical protein